jgi:hypothetical protein
MAFHSKAPLEEQRIHQVFQTQAALTPDAIAVAFQDDQITYGDLNARANQLASFLSARGVGPGCVVGIAVDRSIEMIAGVFGILKAGGCYLPIGHGYRCRPREPGRSRCRSEGIAKLPDGKITGLHGASGLRAIKSVTGSWTARCYLQRKQTAMWCEDMKQLM